MAPALRVVTFGFINPRKIVGVEVQRALAEANWVVIGGMWRLSLRTGMQFAVGLCLWLTWFFALHSVQGKGSWRRGRRHTDRLGFLPRGRLAGLFLFFRLRSPVTDASFTNENNSQEETKAGADPLLLSPGLPFASI